MKRCLVALVLVLYACSTAVGTDVFLRTKSNPEDSNEAEMFDAMVFRTFANNDEFSVVNRYWVAEYRLECQLIKRSNSVLVYAILLEQMTCFGRAVWDYRGDSWASGSLSFVRDDIAAWAMDTIRNLEHIKAQ